MTLVANIPLETRGVHVFQTRLQFEPHRTVNQSGGTSKLFLGGLEQSLDSRFLADVRLQRNCISAAAADLANHGPRGVMIALIIDADGVPARGG